MWFFIDSTQASEFRLGTIQGPQIEIRTYEGRSNRILLELSRLMSKKKDKKVEGFCVVSGPGSFTSVRTGVLLANIFARCLKKPLVGIDANEALDTKKIAASLNAGAFCFSSYVSPSYSAEPNITIKKYQA